MDEKMLVLRDVAKYYYLENMTQAQIARRLGLSRPKVSRLLAGAREKGIVKVFIIEMDEDMGHLERELMAHFNLRKVKVVPVPPSDHELAFQITTREAAKYIADLLEPDDRIGVGWGGTLFEVSKNMQHLALSKSMIVQLFGNLDIGGANDYANDIVNQFAQKLDSRAAHTIPCPVIVDNQIIVDILMHDEKVRQKINLAKSCNKMIINIGLPNVENCLYRGGYINDQDLDQLIAKNAVGCLGCRFFDENGNVCDEQLNNRTIGVSMEDIRNAGCVITCVSGTSKALSLYAAMKAGYLDIVIVDSNAALEVLKMATKEKVSQ